MSLEKKTTNTPNDQLISGVIPHLHPTFGADMNVNASFGGTPKIIYKEDVGIPTEWDATTISGVWDFASTTEAHTGTKSIDGTAVEDTAEMDLANGGDVSGYVAVTGWIYVTQWSEIRNNHLAFYGIESGAPIGNEIELEDYFDTALLGTWQKFSVPLADMGLSTALIDSFRFRVDSDTPIVFAPGFYLDDIQLEETGSPAEFLAEPQPNTWFHVKKIRGTFVITKDPALADTFGMALDPDKFFEVVVSTSGFINIIQSDGSIVFSISLSDLKTYMNIPGAKITNYTVTATKIMLTVETDLTEHITLKAEKGDYSKIIITENLSSLEYFRVFLGGVIEPRD